MSKTIDGFVANYRRELDYYQEAARLASLCCEALLSRNGIRGIVTYRAKRTDRLRDKLIQRDQERRASGVRAYRTAEEIRTDIIDLSGVRIALYFPADRVRIDTLIREEFTVHKDKEFPTCGERRPDKRFDGYHATHYHVSLRENSVANPSDRYLSAIVEVQVASVLMHAWSEVEHDLIYKPLSGELSEDELAILDELNGLVITGEIALERLQRAVETRVSKENAEFTNLYELAAFLYDESKALRAEDESEPTMGDVGALLALIRSAGLNRPESLKPYLQALRDETESRPMADQVVDVILAERPEFYSAFSSRRSPFETSFASAQPALDLAQDRSLVEFLRRWLVIERFSQFLAKAHDPSLSLRALVPPREIETLLRSDPPLANRLRWLRSMRNKIVHGHRGVSSRNLAEACSEAEDLIRSLQESNDPMIREAIELAKDPNGPSGRIME